MRTVLDSLISTLFPHLCRVCGRNVGSLKLGPACSDCWSGTRIFSGDEALCPKCGNFLRDGRAVSVGRCHRCDSHGYRQAVACGAYERALSATVLELKVTPRLPAIARDILLCRFENSELARCDSIIPIPLSQKRQRERGFNQAEILAVAIGREFGINVDSESLLRVSHTQVHRGGMDDKARDMTVRKAFRVKSPGGVEGRRIVLVDDVMTSGATAAHCADELLRGGAESVDVFTLARTL